MTHQLKNVVSSKQMNGQMTRDAVYGAFVDYYGDVTLKKMKTEEGYAVYATRVYSGLAVNRYIFAIVPNRFARAPEAILNDLDWVSLQTRTSDDNHPVPLAHIYLDQQRKESLGDILTLLERDAKKTVYITDSLPIRVTLLHDLKRNNVLQFPDKVQLFKALESYRCVIEIL